MPIDPVIKEIQAAVRAQAPKASKTPAGWRAQAIEIDRIMAELAYTAGPPVLTTDLVIPIPDQPDLQLRLYQPQSDSGPATTEARPAYLGFFGGAFRQGGLDYPSIDAAFRTRAQEAGIVVVGVGYALAPEHPFPTAAEQGYAALEWVAVHGAEHGIDPSRIAIGGMSSGGNLAAAVALMSRDRGGPTLALQLLEVPALDLTGRHLDLSIGWGLGLPPRLLKFGLMRVAKDYLGRGRATARLPYASPLLAADLTGLPPARIMTAEFDVLRGDGEAYATRLREAGIDASATRYIGQTHESSFLTKNLPGARHWQATATATLKEFLYASD